MIRPAARAQLWRAREAILGVAVAGLGVWLASLGGLILLPFGAALLALGVALALLAWRRMRFRTGGGAPGLVELDEGEIRYFGPQGGGFLSLRELTELRLLSRSGHSFWRLKQADGQALLIPVAAEGAEALFDAFAALPGMDSQALVAALALPRTQAGGTELALPRDMLGPVIWSRPTTKSLR